MRPYVLAAWLLAHAGAVGRLGAQRVERRFSPAERTVPTMIGAGFVRVSGPEESIRARWPQLADTTRDSAVVRRRASAWAALASAVVPGAGQALMRQRRALVYFAIEALTLSSYASNSSKARRARDGYRSLASDVARAPFSDVRPTGDFDYYERMEHYLSSGRFDLASDGLPIRPEEDTTTFNGAMWLLARRTYWTDPSLAPSRGSVEWIRAEAFYLQRAVRPAYRWSWEANPSEYGRFKQLIRRSNDSYRAALSDIGWTLGNHVLSTIDASVSIRLRRQETALGRAYGVSVSLPFEVTRR